VAKSAATYRSRHDRGILVEHSKVKRNVTIQNSVASRLEVNLEKVGGNVQLMNNTGR